MFVNEVEGRLSQARKILKEYLKGHKQENFQGKFTINEDNEVILHY